MTNHQTATGNESVPTVPAMPLPLLGAGQTARVAGIVQAGQGMTRKLVAMGILPDVQVTVLSTQGGPILLRVGEGRFAIGRGLAQRILVRPGA